MSSSPVKDAIKAFNAHLRFCDSPEDCPDIVGLAAAIRDLKAEQRYKADFLQRIEDENVRSLLENLIEHTPDWRNAAEDLAWHFIDLQARFSAIHKMPIQIREFHDDGRGWLDDWRDIKLNQGIDNFIHRHPMIQIRIKP